MLKKFREAILAVIPISLIILILGLTIVPFSVAEFITFVLGTFLAILGIFSFKYGTEISIIPLGEKIGIHLTKSKRIFLILIGTFFLGAIITVAEPDLLVLANQITTISTFKFVLIASIGLGIFLVISQIRVLYQMDLKCLLIILYLIVFILISIAPIEFIPIAFDAGVASTGSISIPLIMAIGLGFSSLRSDKNAKNDSFGYVAICSLGPIIAILLSSLLFPKTVYEYNINLPNTSTIINVLDEFKNAFPFYLKQVFLSLVPIMIYFAFIYKFYFKTKKSSLRLQKGIACIFLGTVLSLIGANIGFLPIAYKIGSVLALSEYSLIIVPIGILIGYFIVNAEPLVLVLTEQVEEATSGIITKRVMKNCLSVGVAFAAGLAMIRLIYDIPIVYFILPSYTIALIISLFTPKIFTGIAFDFGSVASGPMTATFLVPFAIGVSESLGVEVFKDAFGLAGLVAITPLITVQLVGITYKLRMHIAKRYSCFDETIVEYEVVL